MDRLRVFAPATRLDRYLPQFLASCGRHGIHPVLLGAGHPGAEPGMGFRLLRRYLEQVPGHRLVLFLEPRHAVFQRGPGAIAAAYRDLGHPLVVAGRRTRRRTDPAAAATPAGPGPYRWPDADAWVGEADALLALLAAGAGDGPPADAPEGWRTALERYVLDHPGCCRVDRDGVIFHPCDDDAGLDCADGAVRSRATGATPCVLLGDHRTDLAAVLRALGLPTRPFAGQTAPPAPALVE